jgi:hypothetical protein
MIRCKFERFNLINQINTINNPFLRSLFFYDKNIKFNLFYSAFNRFWQYHEL